MGILNSEAPDEIVGGSDVLPRLLTDLNRQSYSMGFLQQNAASSDGLRISQTVQDDGSYSLS